jgi:hypothetical protein
MARRLTAGVVAAVVLGLAGASVASADTVYPPNANTFTSDTQNWKDASHDCGLTLGPLVLPLGAISPLLCSVTNDYAPAVGDPAGSLKTSYTGIAGVLDLIGGTGTWRSPSFTISGTPTGGTFSLDRQADIQGLINVGGKATFSVTLKDETTNAPPLTLIASSLAPTNGFESVPLTRALTAAELVSGHRYHIDINTAMTSTLQAVSNPVSVFYDNIKLQVADGTDTGVVKAVASTLAATNVTATSATLNGAVDAKGSQTWYQFQYGGTNAYGITTARTDGGSGVGPQTRSVAVTGLTKCTTYHYRVRAGNTINTALTKTDPATDNTQDTLGQDVTFTTNCEPSVTTLPVAPISATTATFNGTINPNGPETIYRYEWGPTTAYGKSTPIRSAGSGTEAKVPLSEPVSGLTPSTTYHVRLVAQNALGTVAGADQVFTTPAQSGPGPAGAPGAPGAPGAQGPAGVSGSGTNSNTNTTLNNGDTRALLRIRSRIARVGLRGSRAGQIRIPIFCSAKTGRSCAGTVKIRTRYPINPSSLGRKKAKRKVTLATFEYQLANGKVGYAISTIQPEKLRLMRRLRSVAVTISVQVTDSSNNRQTIVTNGTFKAQNSV